MPGSTPPTCPHGHAVPHRIRRTTWLIAPQIQFDLRLPMTTWQGSYLQTGCGGNCGVVTSGSAPAATGCVPLTDGALAVATDDQGHYGTSTSSGIFATDPTLKADFGYKSEHQLAVVAKDIIKRFYGQAATHSYYDGCSQGGHEALTEAQRYPTDFDGIVAGAPANNWTAHTFQHAWNAHAVFAGADGTATLTTTDLKPLHAVVLAGCGATDDGIIEDPLACAWDPGSIACASGQTSTAADFCLTSAQVTTVRKMYSGPRDEHGELLYPGWQLRGSELNWAGATVPTTATGSTSNQTNVNERVRYLLYPQAHPELSWKDVEFASANYRKLMKLNEGMMDATDPDLSAFKAAGGKLIIWHGLADPNISSVASMAYYQAAQKKMGGAAATQDFARLFLLPGVAHCGGGQGPDSIDALSAIIGWVTEDQAPDSLFSQDIDSGGNVTAARPVYPYPYIAETRPAATRPACPPRSRTSGWTTSARSAPATRR
ncbi:tannase/feruloyl esterase family alpha/beta hydrolase [Streptomyces sp. NBC_00620]|uniref:tannase/feruloyl esterase family alpha/beta hydrolase n=1 Tax=Streptomyces sp. NBC_00620 TaxID=2903666 RepID=UPI002257EED8|nr:tannase/feruloyl esterase family alpha/beta hydrolase [Streptomyces sp. NBC_00620]MCX4978845.1 tannase/feruloyl esterase family alpha/beta hydrolase [Streptomyces sp. NBC_00620]